MSNQAKNGVSRESYQRAAEIHGGAAHAHTVAAVAHEKQDHLTAHESSRLALESSQEAHRHSQYTNLGAGEFGHAELATLANDLWKARGCPEGSPDADWFAAAKQLRTAVMEAKL